MTHPKQNSHISHCTWSCLSFLAKAGRFLAIAMTTAAACCCGRKGRSLEMSRFPLRTDMIIKHCSSLTLRRRKRGLIIHRMFILEVPRIMTMMLVLTGRPTLSLGASCRVAACEICAVQAERLFGAQGSARISSRSLAPQAVECTSV